MELIGLKALHMNNPLGINTMPYFSWIIKSEEHGVTQTAYRLRVSRDSEVVWDSGNIKSDQSAFLPYEGSALQSRTRYRWTVTVWDNQGNDASAEAWFETAFFSADDWKAAWAVSPFTHAERKLNWGNQPPATMFRKAFTLKGEVAQARLYATCHGVYRLTVNGRRPDDREFAPEYTSYVKCLYYQTYDITSLLRPGSNALGMYVGDGWFCGLMTAFKENNDFRHAALFQLEVLYACGGREVICSDEGVKASQGPVLFSDLFAGEKYDANAEAEGWDRADFADADWTPAVTGDYGFTNLTAQLGPPVRPVVTVPAARAYISPKGEKIVDFGQNLAGRVRMRVSAPKGTEITLDHFEAPDRDGNYWNNILVTRNGPLCEQRVQYISDGKPREFEALFTFQGFRYVRVTGLDEVRAEDFAAVALSSDLVSAGTFECSDARLNQLYENTIWSHRSNMLSIPTDCPQREKAGWTNDAQAYAATAVQNADMTAFYTRWLRNMALDQTDDGRVPITVPYNRYYSMSEHRNPTESGMIGAAGFGDAAVIIPFALYQATGNTLLLSEQYSSMKGWCDYVVLASARRGDEDLPEEIEQYLWNTGFQYGEWMIPSLFKGGYGNPESAKRVYATGKYTGPIFAWVSLTLTSQTAALLGYDADAAHYARLADKIKDAFAKGIIGKDGSMPFRLMGAYVMPLYHDLVPEEHKKRFADTLISLIEENGGCLDTGFMATPLLLDALCKIGRMDLAYQVLYQEKAPSWLFQVKSGATTIWESWHCYGEDGNPIPMSMNHYALGCVDDWMFRYIGGMERGEAGYKRIVIHPRPDASLTFAKRTFMSEYGEISCAWERKGGEFRLSVTIPCNTTATVILPDGAAHEVGSGRYTFVSKEQKGCLQ